MLLGEHSAILATCIKIPQREHSAILVTCIKIPHGFQTFVLSILEWPLKTCFTEFLFMVVAVFLGYNQYWPGGFMVLWSLMSRSTRRLTGSGSDFKASQKTGPRLKVSSNRLGEAGNQTCYPWFTRHRFIPYTTAVSLYSPTAYMSYKKRFQQELILVFHRSCFTGIYVVTLPVQLKFELYCTHRATHIASLIPVLRHY